jgi:predicted dehydrogenase
LEDVVALVEVNPKHSRELRENFFPEAAEYSLLDDLLGDSANPQAALEALMVVTPHAAHFPKAKSALEHGLDVLAEKPMETSLAHVPEKIGRARANCSTSRSRRRTPRRR